ncbi:MAG: DUF5368 family protein [Pseudomonadota bacterium]|uniref:DUF5368 family protein n=1 Tax=Fodinicurvata fenggangensis TaxID=1121830 RepID=UPI00047B7558|nr:DUF5368 family protein [Fodinicurvata fenggangensis]
MSEFDPLSLFAILYESFGVWFWPAVILACLLLVSIIASVVLIRRKDLAFGRPVLIALAVGATTTFIATLLAPAWTHADLGALGSIVDVVAAVALALVPGAAAAALAFLLVAVISTGRRRL